MRNMSGSVQGDTVTALKSIGLTNDKSEPLALFSEYVLADDEARKRILARILRNTYPFLFDKEIIDIERATTNQVAETFRTHGGVSGSTLPRVILFFIAAAKEAEIKISPLVKAPRTNKVPKDFISKSRKSKERVKLVDQTSDDGQVPTIPNTHSFEIPLPNKGSVKITVPQNLDADDWVLISTMMRAYIERWKGFSTPKPSNKDVGITTKL